MKHYVCQVGFEQDQLDKEGKPKIKKYKFLVQDETLYAAMMTLQEYMKTESRGHEVISIAEAKFEDIIGQKTKVSVIK